MNKPSLRKEILQGLKGQDKQLKKATDQALHQFFWQTQAYQESQTLALFLSMDFEVDTAPLIQRALADQKRVLVPKVVEKGVMVFLPYQAAYLERSSFGVLEPTRGEVVPAQEIDLMLVPGLAWNSQGYRIGYGGGFYDRYLVDCTARTVSLAYPFQVQEFSPEAYDIPVEEVLICE